jgi:hypothetical protein
MEVEMRLPDRNPFSFFTLPLILLLAGLIVLTAPPGSSRADDPFIKTEDYSTPALPGTRAGGGLKNNNFPFLLNFKLAIYFFLEYRPHAFPRDIRRKLFGVPPADPGFRKNQVQLG